MEFHYIQTQFYKIEFEPVKIEDLRVVIGVGEYINSKDIFIELTKIFIFPNKPFFMIP